MGRRNEYTQGCQGAGGIKRVFFLVGKPVDFFEILQIGRKWCNLKQFKPVLYVCLSSLSVFFVCVLYGPCCLI